MSWHGHWADGSSGIRPEGAGMLPSAASGCRSQPEALSLSLSSGSLSTLQHLYHLGISWESFLFVGYVLLLAHVFFPRVSRPSILFK